MPNFSRCHIGARPKSLLSLVLPSILAVSCAQPPSPPPPPAVTPTPAPTVAVKNPLDVPTPIIGKPYPAKGVITIVNFKEGWVEINHEEIEGLMPAMQMEWPVKPKSLMKSLRVGDKVEFSVVETGKGEIITAIKAVPK